MKLSRRLSSARQQHHMVICRPRLRMMQQHNTLYAAAHYWHPTCEPRPPREPSHSPDCFGMFRRAPRGLSLPDSPG
eukprot:921455-Pyramimonas_sp.AAC.1